MGSISKTISLEEFEQASLEALGALLWGYSFEYCGLHSRPKGAALEFARGDDRLFVAHEGGVVYLDFLTPIDGGCFCRVSLNQALWFEGVKVVARVRSVRSQLITFSEEIPRHFENLLRHGPSSFDSRFCFHLSGEDAEFYLSVQRGML